MEEISTEAALEALERNQPKRAKHILREIVGKETRYEFKHGHIFEVVERTDRETGEQYDSRECAALGCELMQTHNNWEDIKRVAKQTECPAPLESFELKLPDY